MILAINTGLSNARSEGYNRIVKHIGRIAFGFRTPENQRQWVRWARARQSRRATSSARQLLPCYLGRARNCPHPFRISEGVIAACDSG